MKISVIGSGSWGTALAAVLADNGHEVRLYGRNPAEVAGINEEHRHRRYFGEVLLPPSLIAVADVGELVGYHDLVLVAVPTHAFPDVYPMLRRLLTEESVLVNVAKGFEPGSGKRLSVALRDALAGCRYRGIVSLIGPSHAEEVVCRMLTSVAAVSSDAGAAALVQRAFSNEYMRVYVSEDEIGAEYGVAIKNVIALASGMLDGRGYGDNAKAALITRGLVETVRYGVAKGGRRETFFGLTGVGDLIVTCFSPHSRNYRAGQRIGEADSGEALRDFGFTVEGVGSCREVTADARRLSIEMPIVFAVHAVLFEGARPSDAIAALMQRPLKAE